MSLRPDFVRTQIADLLAAHPELAEDDDLRADMLEGSTDLYPALDGLVTKIRAEECLQGAVTERIKSLQERRSASEAREKSLRSTVQRILDDANLRKPLRLTEGTVSLRATPPSVIITDATQLPAGFWRTTLTPDKGAIKHSLEGGYPVPGAQLSQGGETLSLRTA